MSIMWTFRRRCVWLAAGLIIVLVTLYYKRTFPLTNTATTQRNVKGHPDRIIKIGEQLYGVIDATHDEKNYDSLLDSGEQYDARGTNSRESEIVVESDEKRIVVPSKKSDVISEEINIDQRTNVSKVRSADKMITYLHVNTNSTRNAQQGGHARENAAQSISRNQKLGKSGADYPSVDHAKIRTGHGEQGSGGDKHKSQQRALDRGKVSVTLRERLVDYCNPPYTPVNGDEGHLPSGNYRLRSVHMIMRHGDRTPMLDLKYPTITWEPSWHCDLQDASRNPSFKQLSHFIESVESSRHSSEEPGLKVAMYLQQLPVGVFAKLCIKAQMTPEGWMQQIMLGEHMRAAYKGALFSKAATWRDPALPVTIFSTFNSRTQQSAFAFMSGLLPGLRHQDGSRVQLVRNVNFCQGILCNCAAVGQLLSMKNAASSRRQKYDKRLAEVRLEIENILMPTATKPDRKRVIPGISGLQEMFLSSLCHNISLPCGPTKCITPDLVERLINCTDTMAEDLRADDEDGPHVRYARMNMHPLLSEISRDMQVMSNRKGHDPHFKLYSGHDITLSPLIDALGIPSHRAPAYASRIVFELWTDRYSQNYVRILYNGKDQMKHVRFCRGKVNKDGLCPLQYFMSFIKHDNMQYFKTNSYAEACLLNFNE